MRGILNRIETRAKDTARAAALTMLGLIFGFCGLICLSAALWIVIASSEGALVAFIAIGLIYVALGFGCVAVGAMQRSGSPHAYKDDQAHRHPPDHHSREPLVQLAEGFAAGLQAGRAARDSR